MEEPTYNPSRPMPSLQIVYNHKVENAPGKIMIGLRVDFPPNASTPPHRHGGAAVSAYVFSGTLQNKMNDDPMKIIETGGSWHEAPGCHHRISNNASETEPAVMLATMVLDEEDFEARGMGALIQIDEEYLPSRSN
ncbi:hypothetical protein BJX99DRAFT_218202 [Aspergillus californicus]